jgi:hypothetical protein
VGQALAAGELKALGGNLHVTQADLDACAHLVGQIGCAPFERALALEPDVIIAGRACDTAVFASLPKMLGFDMANVMHMAKIIECTSICCEPGGRDAMLATLDAKGFALESMNPARRATPLSVAAHSLYEQADPISFTEPDGTLKVDAARYTALDERRTHVTGATSRLPSAQVGRGPRSRGVRGGRRVKEYLMLVVFHSNNLHQRRLVVNISPSPGD